MRLLNYYKTQRHYFTQKNLILEMFPTMCPFFQIFTELIKTYLIEIINFLQIKINRMTTINLSSC
jgi:hypothetical protein